MTEVPDFWPWAVLALTSFLSLIGLLGVLVPLLPGTTLIYAAMILHKLLLPESVSWALIGWLGAIWLVSVIVDFAGVLVGTKLFGGTKWGMAGASGGALIGLFFSFPALILGTIFGAILAERYVAKRSGRQSLMAGAGAAVGFALSTAGRLACAFAMIAIFVWAVLQTL